MTEPELKKPRIDATGYKMNLSEMLDKGEENKSFHELLDLPISSLQGIAERADEMMEEFGVKSIKDLAEWKYGVIAHAIEICASTEVEGKRPVDSTLNIDNAVMKEHEAKSFKEIAALPPSALEGLTDKAVELLESHHIDTVSKLANWKYIKWSQAIVELAKYEEMKSDEERKTERALNKLK